MREDGGLGEVYIASANWRRSPLRLHHHLAAHSTEVRSLRERPLVQGAGGVDRVAGDVDCHSSPQLARSCVWVIRGIGTVFQKRIRLLENSSDDACETRQDHYTAHLTANY